MLAKKSKLKSDLEKIMSETSDAKTKESLKKILDGDKILLGNIKNKIINDIDGTKNLAMALFTERLSAEQDGVFENLSKEEKFIAIYHFMNVINAVINHYEQVILTNRPILGDMPGALLLLVGFPLNEEDYTEAQQYWESKALRETGINVSKVAKALYDQKNNLN